MKRAMIQCAAAAALLASGYALAQDTSFTVEPEQRTIIHEYIVKERVKPVVVAEELKVGMTVPDEVELAPVPEEIYSKIPTAQKYEYFYWNDRVVFVDPDDRKIVQIVD